MAQPSHADILAALKAQSSRPAPPTVTHAELASAAPESLTNPGKPALNSRKFYCPREGCRAVIIGPGNAAYIEAKEDLVSWSRVWNASGRVVYARTSLAVEEPRQLRVPLPQFCEVADILSFRHQTARPSAPRERPTGTSAGRPSRSTTLASRSRTARRPCRQTFWA
jgi:hypothetical protein